MDYHLRSSSSNLKLARVEYVCPPCSYIPECLQLTDTGKLTLRSADQSVMMSLNPFDLKADNYYARHLLKYICYYILT